jgi:hypothetical protein
MGFEVQDPGSKPGGTGEGVSGAGLTPGLHTLYGAMLVTGVSLLGAKPGATARS